MKHREKVKVDYNTSFAYARVISETTGLLVVKFYVYYEHYVDGKTITEIYLIMRSNNLTSAQNFA